MKDKPLILVEQICKEIQKAGDIFLMQEFLLQLMEDPENLYYDEDEPDYDEMEEEIIEYIQVCARKAALKLGYPIDVPFITTTESFTA